MHSSNNTNTISLDKLAVRVRSNTYRQPNSAKRLEQQQQQQQQGVVADASSGGGDLSDPVVANPDLMVCDPEVILIHPPGDNATSRRGDYMSCFTIEHEFSNVPTYSEHGVNPERHYDLQVAGQRHAEGGWPRDCDPTDPEHRVRHLRRTRKEAHFLSTVRELVGKAMPVLKSNNAIDIYHSMFSDILEGSLGDAGSTAAVAMTRPGKAAAAANGESNSSSKKNKMGDEFGLDGDDDDVDDDTTASPGGGSRYGEEDDDEDFDGGDDNDDDDTFGGGKRRQRKSQQQRREQDKQLAAKRAQHKAEELQVAALAGRTVALNATGVFRDAPRAFPGELLGSGVKDLVRAEQRKLMEQRLHEMDREAQKKEREQQQQQHQQHHNSAASGARRNSPPNAAAAAASPTSNINNNNNSAGAREHAYKNTVKNVQLGSTAAFSAPKVVSSLSWVSHLDIPGCPGTGAGSTTLAIALASVAHTPHLTLLGSSAAQQLRTAIAHRRTSLVGHNSGTMSSSGEFSPSGSAATFASTGGGSGSASDIMMSGVDLFPTSLIYDAASPQAPLLRLQTASDLTQLEFSPRDLPLLAAGSSDGTLSLFDLRRGSARSLVVADVCNAAPSSSSASASGSPQQQMFGRGGGQSPSGLSAAAAASRRNPLNPVTSLRWVPSGTGSRCTEFVTADFSPVVRIWDTRFLSRGCLDVLNLSSGAVLGAMQEAGLDVGGMFGSHGNNNKNSSSDDDEGDGHHHHRQRASNGSFFANNNHSHVMHRAISIDVQHISGRIYIGTTDGKVFVFNRKGRTDSDRLIGVYQIVPKDVVFAGAEVYVHVAAHPTLPKCFAAATEWGVQVYADDLSRPVARLPPSSLNGVATSIRWVPHCAALLCVSRISGAVELWDVVVMLTTSPTGSGAGRPKAQTQVMQYSQQQGGATDMSGSESSSNSGNGARLVSSTAAIAAASGPPISALRFSPDGSHLVAGLLDGSATLLDVTVNDDVGLVTAAEKAAAACGPKGVAPVTGARALELTCFGRVLEHKGAVREARLLQLQQSSAPDSTQSSNFVYENSGGGGGGGGSASSSASVAAAMSNDKMTTDMARLSHQFQQAVASESSSTISSGGGGHSTTSTTTTVVAPHHSSTTENAAAAAAASAWVPPFRSTDHRAARVMERVGNILYNPNAFSSPAALLSAEDTPFSSSKAALAAPPAVDEASVKQVARAIETGVAVPPEKSVAARRWSTVKRNLLPSRPKTASSSSAASSGVWAPAPPAHTARRFSASDVVATSSSSLPAMKQQSGSGEFEQQSLTARPPSAPRRPRSVAVRIEHDDDEA